LQQGDRLVEQVQRLRCRVAQLAAHVRGDLGQVSERLAAAGAAFDRTVHQVVHGEQVLKDLEEVVGRRDDLFTRGLERLKRPVRPGDPGPVPGLVGQTLALHPLLAVDRGVRDGQDGHHGVRDAVGVLLRLDVLDRLEQQVDVVSQLFVLVRGGLRVGVVRLPRRLLRGVPERPDPGDSHAATGDVAAEVARDGTAGGAFAEFRGVRLGTPTATAHDRLLDVGFTSTLAAGRQPGTALRGGLPGRTAQRGRTLWVRPR
jgi:hypothetical protein